jgi:septal ring factor EnvC (AmiA/AmiB activator)
MSDIRYINRRVLEALKPMGRMDGDIPMASANESTTIEAWRRECERLRQDNTKLKHEAERLEAVSAQLCDKVVQLEAVLAGVRQGEMEKITEIKRLRQEIERLKAQRGDAIVGENEALRIIIRHLAKIL